MRSLAVLLLPLLLLVVPLPSSGQETSRQPYLTWSASEAERIGKSTRVAGRVGGLFDLRVVHTERSFNYKLRATWLTRDVVQAAARLQQLTDRLTDSQTEELVKEAAAAGDIVVMVEVDPREGSGVIPNDWAAFLGPAGEERAVAHGVNTPALERVKALRGVYHRDYNYELFWVVFPFRTDDGAALFPNGATQATLAVRIAGKEGRVTFPIPDYLRSR